MLVRRGFHAKPSLRDLPFPEGFGETEADAVAALLAHYGFRLFIRGAIQRASRFVPSDTTRFLDPGLARDFADGLVGLGLAARLDRGRYRLIHPARSFGPMLEWYVARELEHRLGFATAVGLKLDVKGVGGDLDVVAVAEGKLVYLELKSSPPKHISPSEVRAFFERLAALRPDLSLFVIDTALRLGDKVIPLLTDEMARRGQTSFRSHRVERELWALTPHCYAVNAKPDLMGNVARAIALGFQALAPESP